ncbi:FtsZ-binding cell division protein ZapB [Paenibacillus shirakamiensis]|uniref:FtsZ-binding cell division protein ZapB n=1 Tax=Paenibacillus shirakamiensis TaxID=1265935 RepID=A0ABS4JIZ5_9BACL|nr:hypothetical protein [Paenibacillus shirakamiensis]MBP2001673.1 FtsZ-binding cell division protein ZapB [Paenibacillus shirakamiensis]
MRNIGARTWIGLIILSITALVLFPGPRAEAGYFDDLFKGVKDITELPNEVNALKKDYQHTMDKLDEATSTLDAYKVQNEQLIAQNQKLTETVQTLMDAEQSRQTSSKRIRSLIVTGIILLVGYFVLLRVLRLVLRRK